MKVILKDVRLSFPDLFVAKSVMGSEPKFGAAFLLEPGSENEKAVKAAVVEVAKEKWGAKAEATLKQLTSGDKICLHNGDTKEYEGYAGMLYLNANNAAKPIVLDKDAKTHLDSTSGRPYAGCYVNASISLWAQDNQFGKRINASLGGVQFVRDGDAFAGGGVATEEDFADLAVTEDFDLDAAAMALV